MQIKVGLVIGCNKICINNIFSVAAGEIRWKYFSNGR